MEIDEYRLTRESHTKMVVISVRVMDEYVIISMFCVRALLHALDVGSGVSQATLKRDLLVTQRDPAIHFQLKRCMFIVNFPHWAEPPPIVLRHAHAAPIPGRLLTLHLEGSHPQRAAAAGSWRTTPLIQGAPW